MLTESMPCSQAFLLPGLLCHSIEVLLPIAYVTDQCVLVIILESDKASNLIYFFLKIALGL